MFILALMKALQEVPFPSLRCSLYHGRNCFWDSSCEASSVLFRMGIIGDFKRWFVTVQRKAHFVSGSYFPGYTVV